MLESLGDRVRKLRIKHKLTQKELANKIGISHSTLSKIESGFKENTDKKTLLQIADVFEVSIDYLFGKSKSPDILDVEEEFASRLELDLTDKDILEKFELKMDGVTLSDEQAKAAIAVLRSLLKK